MGKPTILPDTLPYIYNPLWELNLWLYVWWPGRIVESEVATGLKAFLGKLVLDPVGLLR